MTKFLAQYNRSGIRGSYRISQFLAQRLKSLQCVPVETEGGLIYLDLRIGSARAILADPKSNTGEDKVMRTFVKPGDIVFDIGAHLGLYTVLMSRLVSERGHVFAFEPNPELLPNLRKTVKHLGNATLLEHALSNKNDDIELYVPEDASMASLSDWTKGIAGNVHKVSCEMKVLDELCNSGALPMPDFIKCDVEGGELSVFAGAVNILNKVQAPVILFELNRKAVESFGGKVSDYFDFFKSLDFPKYSFFEVQQSGTKELETWNLNYANILAVPAKRRQ